jgi:hypothetical protein
VIEAVSGVDSETVSVVATNIGAGGCGYRFQKGGGDVPSAVEILRRLR